FFDFLAESYAMSQSVAVRRQAEVNDRVISLGTLIAEIAANPQLASRDRYVTMWPPDMQQLGFKEFEEIFGGSTKAHVDADLVSADLDQLVQSADGIKSYVDKHVAHYDRKPLKSLPTFAELDAAVDQLGTTFQRYNLLLTASSRTKIAPVVQYD